MNLKEKIKSYSFWVSLASAVILILKILGNRFGFVVDEGMISDLFTALCSILVLLGIIVVPTTTTTKNSDISTKNKIQPSITSNQETNQVSNEHKIETPKLVNNIDNQSVINQTENTIQTSNNNSTLQDIDYIEETKSDSPQEISDNLKDCTPINTNIIEKNETLINTEESNEIENVSNTENLKFILNNEREKFKNNLNAYIFELQEEIRKTRENM